MQTGTRPLHIIVIPVWIPFKSAARIELLNVASRIVANQKSLSEDTAVFTYIEVEALYLEINHGLDRSGQNVERSGGYVRRITTLTSIIRDKLGSKDCQPTIEFEKFVLQPGAEGPNAHVLEGEIGIAWPAESALGGASPELTMDQRCATDELGTLILNKVQKTHPLLFTMQRVVSVNKRPKAVVDSTVTCGASASWQNHAAVIQGTLDLILHLEYADGTLGRRPESIKYQVPEPLIPNHAHSLYVFIDQCHVDAELAIDAGAGADAGAGFDHEATTNAGAAIGHGKGDGNDIGNCKDQYPVEISITVKGIIAETCTEAFSLHAPIDKTTSHFKAIRISGAIDTPISFQEKELSGAVTVPGMPTGHMTHKLVCGKLEQTGCSLLQELTAICDLFYVDAESEKCLEFQMADIILTSIGNYPVTASYCGTISADGEPVITADLRNPGKYSLTVPISYQLTMRETKIMDAYIDTDTSMAGVGAMTEAGIGIGVGVGVGAENGVGVRTVDTVVEEIVAQKLTSFLVEFPAPAKCPSVAKYPPVKAMPWSELIPELVYECLPETDYCLIKGTANLASYITATDGREVYQPARIDFCEKVIIPGCRPNSMQRCNLHATVIEPAMPTGTPSVLIDVDLLLYHYRRCSIVVGAPTRTAKVSQSAQAGQLAQEAHSTQAGRGIQPAKSAQKLLVLEHRLFWQSRPPSGTDAEPVRIETKAASLKWRIADELLIIDGMVGRALYFVDRNQRLYCSDARLPFRMAASLPEQIEDIRQIRIQRIDGVALPRAKNGVQICLEEEYRIFLEIDRKA